MPKADPIRSFADVLIAIYRRLGPDLNRQAREIFTGSLAVRNTGSETENGIKCIRERVLNPARDQRGCSPP
ncbi:MAG: hypothetical protein Q7N50_15180, partial [Armatimonadota bacterium]|nr:hypothetical protein [Armatimonadota bacterium]